MGTITFDYRNPDGTLTDAPAEAILQARLAQREVVGGAFRTIRKFPIVLVDGVASAVLSDTSPNQAWVVAEPSTIADARTHYKQVDGDGAFADLPSVDPSAFTPLEPLPPSAQEVLAEAAAARDAAEGHALDALESADAASAFADDARDEAVLAEGFAEDAAGSLASLNAQKGAVNGVGSLDDAGKQPETQVPVRLSEASLNATFATLSGPLDSFRRKTPANRIIAFSGDSTMDKATGQGGDFQDRLRLFHTQTGQALAGMTADAAHFIDLGYNGSSLAAFLADPTRVAALIASNADLIVFSWGINDVRLGALANAAAMTTLLRQFIDTIRAGLPNVQFVGRIPSAFRTTNVGGANYIQGPGATINPAGAAQAYSTLLRDSYLALNGLYHGLIIADVQGDLTGSVSRSDDPFIVDQIHPSAKQSATGAGVPVGGGQVLIADYIARIIGGLPGGFNPAGYRTVKRMYVVGGGTNYFDLAGVAPVSAAVVPAAQFPLTVDDLIFFDGNPTPLPLTGLVITRPQSITSIRIAATGSWAATAGTFVWVASQHEDATTNDRQIVSVDLPSIAAGATVSVTASVTGASTTTSGTSGATAVVATPPASLVSAGLFLMACYPNGAGTVAMIIHNPTGSAVDLAAGNFAFWLIR